MFKKCKVIGFLFIIVLFFTVSAVIVFNRNYVPAILMYHSVYSNPDPENRLAVSTEIFERQMRFLKEYRYNVVTLEALADLIKNKKKIPRNTVAITLDDGYKNNYTDAFPILKKYNLPANIFIIVNEVGRPQNDRLNWSQIQEMQDSGIFTIGSHTLGPEPLVNIHDEAVVKEEIFVSKKILEEKLGRKVNIFSYPEGRFNPQIRQMVIDAGYKAAVTTNPGKEFSNNDVFALKRLRISANAGNLFVFWVESSGYYNFMRESRKK
ncbi:MAG: polysaccharide deacetylase family protein [Candidatus Omnitrophica bacterium]|nr:polysaccharide deacetylase family protein [Candidatus Omnitrophota bacterium]